MTRYNILKATVLLGITRYNILAATVLLGMTRHNILAATVLLGMTRYHILTATVLLGITRYNILAATRDNTLKSLKERISVKFDVGVFFFTATKCTQYAVNTFLFYIMLSLTYFVSDGARISEVKYFCVLSLPDDGRI
jgi:hypothetical protein